MSTLKLAYLFHNTLTTAEISKRLGIPRERLNDWLKRGYISPSHPATGTGGQHRFSRSDAYRIYLFQQLLAEGVPRDKAAGVIQELTDGYHFTVMGGETLLTGAGGIPESMKKAIVEVPTANSGLVRQAFEINTEILKQKVDELLG